MRYEYPWVVVTVKKKRFVRRRRVSLEGVQAQGEDEEEIELEMYKKSWLKKVTWGAGRTQV